MNKFLKSMWRYKSTIGIIAIILIVAIAVPLIAKSQQPTHEGSINFILSYVIKNDPELAKASGVRGLVEIGYADLSELESMFARRGERLSIPIFISFTSYDPNLQSVDVLIDPRGNMRVQTWQWWYEYNSEGKEINRGQVRINDLVSYDKEGIVTIEAGGRVECTMFVDIPSDLPPLETKSIMLASYGIGLRNEGQGILFCNGLGREVTLNE